MGAAEVVAETGRALATPRRSLPIAVVALPLVTAQYLYGGSKEALAIGIVLIGSFLLTGPTGYRLLVTQGGRRSPSLPGLLAFVALGVGVIGLGGMALPWFLGMSPTFFTDIPSLAILLGLFWVGGWGLGRDIDLERSLALERERAALLLRERERAELLAVRSHLDPHFLFNALNAIAEWCQEDPAVAERALLRLATMLRTVLGGVQTPTWPLARELELIDHLVAIHEIRDPERFSVQREGWGQCDALPVPPLLLLPVIENAMKHGPAAGHRGPVSVRIWPEGAGVHIEVENPGPFRGPRDGGQGVEMVKRRLALGYPSEARFELGPSPVDSQRTRAHLWLPGPPLDHPT